MGLFCDFISVHYSGIVTRRALIEAAPDNQTVGVEPALVNYYRSSTFSTTQGPFIYTARTAREGDRALRLQRGAMPPAAVNGVTVRTGMRAKRDYILFIQTGPFCCNMECQRAML